MFIDTHGHVNFNAFRDDANETLQRALDSGTLVIMPGSQYSTSQRAVEMAESPEWRDKGIYAAVGLHPIHLGEQREVDVMEVQSQEVEREQWMTFKTREEVFDYELYKALAQSEKVVAIGEVGLDYYRLPKSKGKREEAKQNQKAVLQQQVFLALELDLPVIFHCRVAHEDLIAFISEIKNSSGEKLRGVIHSYTGTKEQAEQFMELGFSFGFNGLIFKQVPALPDPAQVLSAIPLEKMVLETDAPYLTPPMAPTLRNEPEYIRFTAERIAKIKKVSVEEVANQTTQNAKAIFSI